jgi:energy-coupling factor transport system ATP-binding protein
MALVEIRNVSVTYGLGTPYQERALSDVSLKIGDHGFFGIIGPTGSGKSTLIQLMNALIRPDSGEVIFKGTPLSQVKGVDLIKLRSRIGLVFQYPEQQIFEETVAKEIAFGPKNLGLSKQEIEARVAEAMGFVGLDFQEYKNRSPFSLSGGQMRRVAIAGILAMKPEMLILDEPTAGLDPQSRRDILDRIFRIREQWNMTVVLVSHSMEDIARLTDKVFVLNEGKLILEGTPGEVFAQPDLLRRLGLEIPAMTELMFRLASLGISVRKDIFTEPQARDELLKHLKGAGNA